MDEFVAALEERFHYVEVLGTTFTVEDCWWTFHWAVYDGYVRLTRDGVQIWEGFPNEIPAAVEAVVDAYHDW